MSIPLTRESVIHKTGTNPTQGVIKPMRKKYYKVLTESVGGDAPKDVIKFYEYGKGWGTLGTLGTLGDFWDFGDIGDIGNFWDFWDIGDFGDFGAFLGIK